MALHLHRFHIMHFREAQPLILILSSPLFKEIAYRILSPPLEYLYILHFVA